MIRDANKEKQLTWARKNIADDISDCIYSDETTMQMETHGQFCCTKSGLKPRYKPRPKHPTRLIWSLYIEGCMDAVSTSWNKLHAKFDQVSFRSLCKVALNFIRVASDFIQNCFKHMKFDQVSFQSSCEVGPKFAHILPQSSLQNVSTLFAPTVATTTLHN